jgi:hypothetical protein
MSPKPYFVKMSRFETVFVEQVAQNARQKYYFEKMSKYINNRSKGENSPNLVTLHQTKAMKIFHIGFLERLSEVVCLLAHKWHYFGSEIFC